jgi:TonB family protein
MVIALKGVGNSPHWERFLTLAKTGRQLVSLWMVLAAVTAMVCAPTATAQKDSKTQQDSKDGELTRKAKTKVAPVYPDVARRMSVTGTVRLAVVVAPNGTVKSTRVIGGHPVLVNAAEDALKRWKFETAPTESSGVVEFTFQPQN